ncbi:MAG: PTS sugar transporter subunit IIA [Gemmatimonadales bacterium]
MSEELQGVVVCHGELAGALVEAAETICGVTGALVPVTNSGCDRGSLEQRVFDAVNGRPTVVFVDLASGSCLFAVLNRLRSASSVKVVTGVNLAMLVDFVFHRSLSPEEAASRAAEAGGRAIRVP